MIIGIFPICTIILLMNIGDVRSDGDELLMVNLVCFLNNQYIIHWQFILFPIYNTFLSVGRDLYGNHS